VVSTEKKLVLKGGLGESLAVLYRQQNRCLHWTPTKRKRRRRAQYKQTRKEEKRKGAFGDQLEGGSQKGCGGTSTPTKTTTLVLTRKKKRFKGEDTDAMDKESEGGVRLTRMSKKGEKGG